MRKRHKKQISSKARGLLARLAFVLFACRALIPVGYMPAPFSEGGPVVLCHGGMAGEFFRGFSEAQALSNADMHMVDHSTGMSSEHQHTDEHSDASHDAWDNCPVGTAFSAAAVPQEFALSLPEFGHDFGQAEPDAIIRIVSPSLYRARAPPAGFSRHSI
jgi:hypothetical protein